MDPVPVLLVALAAAAARAKPRVASALLASCVALGGFVDHPPGLPHEDECYWGRGRKISGRKRNKKRQR